MQEIKLYKLVRFYPYESIHASSALVRIEDKDHSWGRAIKQLLERYEPNEFVNCTPNYFNLSLDNKITLKLERSGSELYITYWDGFVYISNDYHVMSKDMYCTVKQKRQ